MDPLSALGLAAAVVQFVEFSGSLIADTYKVYKYGSRDPKAGSDIKTITGSLQNLNNELRSNIA